jgi:histidinol dehydrogenase
VLKRLDLRGRGTDLAGVLPRPAIAGEGPRAVVRQLIEDVKREGDAGLLRLTEQFDGVTLSSPRVEPAQLEAAVAALDPGLRAAMETAIEGIEAFHRHQVRAPETVRSPGMTIQAYQRPMRRAGLYVPGGRAEYPSTVLMTAIPARVAGVGEIALCVPPDRRIGAIAPSVLAAAHLAGVREVYAVGGAQAIAALAYGTATIQPVDVIAGPGNVYVALAKQEVAGQVGIAAAFAGPSEVVVVADHSTRPEFAAIDLIVQAEHGPDGLAWLVTWDEPMADAVCAAGERLLAEAPRAAEVRATMEAGGYAVLVDGPEAALAVVNAIAPEHLELQCQGGLELAAGVDNAGAIFCGPWSPASIGDYVAGPSHVLPTYGSARFASALTVSDFCKDHHIVTLEPEGVERLGPHVLALAGVEGLAAHAASVQLRLDEIAVLAGAGSGKTALEQQVRSDGSTAGTR